MTVTGAVGLFLNDRLRGNGHFDRERQRVRGELDWKPALTKGGMVIGTPTTVLDLSLTGWL